MIIIGHRGAAGLAPENTIPSIEAAVREQVDMIEFDVRATKDKHLVVAHDPNLLRVAGYARMVHDMTLEEIQSITTRSGHPIPTFEEALEAAKDIPIFLDCKGKDWAEPVAKALKKHKGPQPTVTSTDVLEMHRFHTLYGKVDTFVCEYVNPFDAIYKARLFKFSGISITFWLMSPLVYHYARYKKLKIMIFTVNYPFIARFIHLLYPQAAIITNVPHRLAPLAARRQKKRK